MFEAEEIGEKMMLEKASTISEIRGFSGDFRWASNFFPIEPFEYDGVMYFTTENYYQAMKTKDKAERVLIAAMTPNKSKRYASSHNLKFIVREDWDYIKLEVMEFALRRKFSQPKFKELLLATRDIFIEETNSWGDVFWGALPSGEGFNNLGLIMMKLRQELRDGKDLLDYKPEIAKLLKKKVKIPTLVVNKDLERFDVYIGRGSKFGNPFSIYTGEYTLEESMFAFEYEISKKLILDKEFRADVLALRGKKLGCSCKKCRTDQEAFATDITDCHGEFYANFLNSLQELV